MKELVSILRIAGLDPGQQDWRLEALVIEARGLGEVPGDGAWLCESVLPETGGVPHAAFLELRRAIERCEFRNEVLAYVRYWLPIGLWVVADSCGAVPRRSDAHVHHGGIFDFADLLGHSNAGPEIRKLLGEADAERYQCAAKLISRLASLRGPRYSSAEVEDLADEFVRTWRHEMRSDEFVEGSRAGDDATGLLVARALDSGASAEACSTILAALIWLYGVLHPSRGTGFSQFQTFFERRWCAGAAPPYGQAIHRLSRDGLDRLELRKNIDFQVNPDSNATGFHLLHERLGELDVDVEITTPVAVSRHMLLRNTTAQSEGSLGAVDASAGRDASVAVRLVPVEWLQDVALGVLSRMISFDCNGSEVGSAPSWVLGWQLLRLADGFSGRLPERQPQVTIHAGEAWVLRHSGLRRVSEALLLPGRIQPTRVGHGLALAASPASNLEEWRQDVVRSLVLDLRHDLAWLHGIAGESRAWRRAWDLAWRGSEFGPQDPVVYERLFTEAYASEVGALDPVALEVLAGPTIHRDVAAWLDGWDRPVQADGLASTEVTALARFLADSFEVAQAHVNDEVLRSGLILEACPTSNIWIGRVNGFGDHPYYEWSRRGHRVTINTDNPGFFGTSVGNEVNRLRTACPPEFEGDVDGWLERSDELAREHTALAT